MNAPGARILGLCLSLIILIVAPVSPCHAGSGGGGADPFADAALAPADVDLYLHVEDAAGIRAMIERRPIARLFGRVIANGEIGAAWESLAKRTEIDPDRLFDLLLGERFTLLVRSTGDVTDWVLITDVNVKKARPVLMQLRPKRLAPRSELPVLALTHNDLLVATDDSTFIIGPKTPGRLFDDVVRTVGGHVTAPRSRRLAGHPAMRRGRDLREAGRPADCALFARHPALSGGWSVATAVVDGPNISIRHAADFDVAPFDRSRTELKWDAAALDAFDDDALVAIMEPTDVEGGAGEAFIENVLGEPLISPEMRANLGDSRIFTIGEVDGRREQEPIDLLLPTAAVAIKIKDADIGRDELDRHLRRLAISVYKLGGPPTVSPPEEVVRPDGARHIDLTPIIERFGGGIPLVRSVSLNWMVVDGPGGASYYVIASHPEQLGQTVASLSKPSGPAKVGAWTNCGTVNGVRLGGHLRSYCDQAAQLAGVSPESNEARAIELRETLVLLSELADGVERCRWRLCRPGTTTMELEVEIELREPESSGDAQTPKRGPHEAK